MVLIPLKVYKAGGEGGPDPGLLLTTRHHWGIPHHPPNHPGPAQSPPLKYWTKFSSGPSDDQKKFGAFGAN